MKATEKKAPRTRTGIDFLIGDDVSQQPTFEASVETGKKASTNNIPPIKQQGDEIRVTLQMPKALHQKIKIMAHLEFSTLKDEINKSLQNTVVQYEMLHGLLVKVPKSEK